MDVLSVVVGVFCFFLFQWLFRGVFLFVLFKVVSQIAERAGKKVENMKGEMENAMQDLRGDEKQKR